MAPGCCMLCCGAGAGGTCEARPVPLDLQGAEEMPGVCFQGLVPLPAGSLPPCFAACPPHVLAAQLPPGSHVPSSLPPGEEEDGDEDDEAEGATGKRAAEDDEVSVDGSQVLCWSRAGWVPRRDPPWQAWARGPGWALEAQLPPLSRARLSRLPLGSCPRGLSPVPFIPVACLEALLAAAGAACAPAPGWHS